MKVLLSGDAEHARGTIFPEDAEYFTSYAQAQDAAPLDAIYLGHDLQKSDRKYVVDVLKDYRDLLREYGELYVTVPSLEWTARELLQVDEPSLAAYHNLYGTEEEPHRSGFVLLWLRVAMQEAGFMVRHATQELYKMTAGDKVYPNVQNLVIGARYDPDPGTALD